MDDTLKTDSRTITAKFMIFLRKLRIREQKTQREMAAVIGVTYRTYQRLESGQLIPDLQLIGKISEVFGFPVNEIIDFKIEDDGYKEVSTIEVNALPYGADFVELANMARNFIEKSNPTSLEVINFMQSNEQFQKAPYWMMASNPNYTIKNDVYSTFMQQPSFKMGETGSNLKNPLLISSWMNRIFCKKNNFGIIKAELSLKQPININYAIYSTQLVDLDHFVLAYAFL